LDDKIITDYDGFSQLERQWALIEESGGVTTPFQSFSWMTQWLTHRACGAEPFIFVLERGKLIAPFTLLKSGGLRVLRLLGSHDSDYLGLVTCLPVDKAWERVAQELVARTNVWDLLHLHSIVDFEEILSALRSQGLVSYHRPYESCPLILTAESWDQFLATRKKIRAEMRRWARRLEEIGSVEISVEEPPIRGELMKELIEVEQASWKWESGNAMFKQSSHSEFFRGVLQDQGTKAKLFLCRISGSLAGFNLVFTAQRRWFYYWAVFRKNYPHVGAYLLGRVVEGAHSSGCTVVDLLRGNEDYKLAWSDGANTVYEIVSPSSLRGQAAALGYAVRWKLAKSSLMHRIRNRILKVGDRRGIGG
jgi:CelD/BcsL family acetyltransferase involved in cellulose biosynthesis